jgi:CheY-like chemotaxis protein
MNRAAATAADFDSCFDRLANLHVLLVEDDAGSRESLACALEGCGALVTAAGSVDEAIHCYEHSTPALVISDIEMPEQDGFALIHQLRALDARDRRHTPAIAVTGLCREGVELEVRAAGFDEHLSKPLDLGLLLDRIRSLLAV